MWHCMSSTLLTINKDLINTKWRSVASSLLHTRDFYVKANAYGLCWSQNSTVEVSPNSNWQTFEDWSTEFRRVPYIYMNVKFSESVDLYNIFPVSWSWRNSSTVHFMIPYYDRDTALASLIWDSDFMNWHWLGA